MLPAAVSGVLRSESTPVSSTPGGQACRSPRGRATGAGTRPGCCRSRPRWSCCRVSAERRRPAGALAGSRARRPDAVDACGLPRRRRRPALSAGELAAGRYAHELELERRRSQQPAGANRERVAGDRLAQQPQLAAQAIEQRSRRPASRSGAPDARCRYRRGGSRAAARRPWCRSASPRSSRRSRDRATGGGARSGGRMSAARSAQARRAARRRRSGAPSLPRAAARRPARARSAAPGRSARLGHEQRAVAGERQARAALRARSPPASTRPPGVEHPERPVRLVGDRDARPSRRPPPAAPPRRGAPSERPGAEHAPARVEPLDPRVAALGRDQLAARVRPPRRQPAERPGARADSRRRCARSARRSRTPAIDRAPRRRRRPRRRDRRPGPPESTRPTASAERRALEIDQRALQASEQIVGDARGGSRGRAPRCSARRAARPRPAGASARAAAERSRLAEPRAARVVAQQAMGARRR